MLRLLCSTSVCAPPETAEDEPRSCTRTRTEPFDEQVRTETETPRPPPAHPTQPCTLQLDDVAVLELLHDRNLAHNLLLHAALQNLLLVQHLDGHLGTRLGMGGKFDPAPPQPDTKQPPTLQSR